MSLRPGGPSLSVSGGGPPCWRDGGELAGAAHLRRRGAQVWRCHPRRRAPATRARALGHRGPGVRWLLPDDARDRRVLPPGRDLVSGPGERGQQRGLLLSRDHRGGPGADGAPLRALSQPRAGGAAGHRSGHRARAARGGHPTRLRALWAPARGHGGQHHPLSDALGAPRGGQGPGGRPDRSRLLGAARVPLGWRGRRCALRPGRARPESPDPPAPGPVDQRAARCATTPLHSPGGLPTGASPGR